MLKQKSVGNVIYVAMVQLMKGPNSCWRLCWAV